MLSRRSQAEWPDEFLEKIAQSVAQPIIVKIDT
jgi:hypothetical protein